MSLNDAYTNRKIRTLHSNSNYRPYRDMSKNVWEIIKLSPVLEFENHNEILILAKQKHSIKVKKKELNFTDYAIFKEWLLPKTQPVDRYFGTLKGARTAFKAQVEKYEKGQKTKSKAIRSKA